MKQKARVAFALACAGFAVSARAQSTPTDMIAQRAMSLDDQGRHDLAAENWRQLLTLRPNDPQALAALASFYRSVGDTVTAKHYMNQLRQLDPAAQQKVAGGLSTSAQGLDQNLLNEAGKLSAQHKYAEALVLYRQAFHGTPPAGSWAVAYYETEAAIPSEGPQAVTGLRDLVRRFPANVSYTLALARVLTYKPATRLEGVRLLQGIKGTGTQISAARDAWRQAILWDPTGPAATETGGEFLARYPDPDLESTLHTATARQVQHAPTQGEEEQGEAFAALNKGHLDDAEKMFRGLMDVQPQRAKAALGLGYIAMQHQEFDKAIQQYEYARQAGLHSPELNEALAKARFWSAMQHGEEALRANQPTVAMASFQKAQTLRADNASLQDALGRTWLQLNQPDRAAGCFEHALKLDESRVDTWTNWFSALVQTGHSDEVLADQQYVPAKVSAQLGNDPEYIAIVAVAALQTGDRDGFHRQLGQLHATADSPRRLTAQMRVASLLLSSGSPRDAAREALEVIKLAPDNVEAWKLVVLAEHVAKRDTTAMTAIENMPAPVMARAQQDVGFAVTMASVQQSLRHYNMATDLLDDARGRAESDPSKLRAIDRQLAAIALAQGQSAQAIQTYAAIVRAQPDDADSWTGLISALHMASQDRAARTQMQLMPAAVAERLQADPGYLQVAASIYTETHDTAQAFAALDASRQFYLQRGQPVPFSIETQHAWAIVAMGDDNRIAATLVQLAHRNDLTAEDQDQIRKLWASWSLRKALRVERQGDTRQSIAILEMAAQAYPTDADIRKGLAGTYMRTGNSKAAVALYEELNWKKAAKDDYLGAISAASSCGHTEKARLWLLEGLERYPNDPQLLTAGAELERAAGDMRKAKEYWRAVLDTPQAKLQAQIGDGGTGALGVASTDALARMLAPHARLDEDGDTAALVSSRRGTREVPEDDTDLNILSSARTARPSRTSGSNQQAPQRGAPAWLTQKVSAAPSAVERPISYGSDVAGQDETLPFAAPAEEPQPAYVAQSRRRQHTSPPMLHPIALRSTDAPEAPSEFSASEPTISYPKDDPSPALGADPDQDLTRSQDAGGTTVRAPFDAQRPESPSSSSSLADNPYAAEVPSSRLSEGTPALGSGFVSRAPSRAQRANEELQDLNSRLSPWAGGTVRVFGRSGTPGFDQLTGSEIRSEASTVLGDSARLTVISKPTFLTSGTVTPGTDGTVATPYNFGKSGTPLLNQPHFQSGVGGEVQLSARSLDGSVGFTPSGFYVRNIIGNLDIHPQHTPFSLGIFREGVEQTMLSFAGERDPLTGDVWGGVVATGVRGGISRGSAESGYYLNLSGAKLTGTNVESNKRVEGSTGAYWTFLTNPAGSLKIGANVTGLHYDQNQGYFTYGQGGYFSPNAYLLFNAPFTWQGRMNKLTYVVSGSLGMQSFDEGSAMSGSLSTNTPTAQSVIGANYNLGGNFAYKLDEHWFLGGFADVNNASNYQARSAGFSVRYMRLPQVQSLVGPTGLMPTQGPRPLLIP